MSIALIVLAGAFLLAALVAAGAILLSRAARAQEFLAATAAASGDLLRTTLYSIGDAVITTVQHGVQGARGNVNDADGLAALIAGHNAVISSVHFSASDPEKLIAAVRKAKVPRYLVVGGAGSLEVAPGTRLIDTPGFPDAYRKEAGGGAAFLDRLRETHDT